MVCAGFSGHFGTAGHVGSEFVYTSAGGLPLVDPATLPRKRRGNCFYRGIVDNCAYRLARQGNEI